MCYRSLVELSHGGVELVNQSGFCVGRAAHNKHNDVVCAADSI
jgi:hypothetical protein